MLISFLTNSFILVFSIFVFYLICGFFDLKRSDLINKEVIKKYLKGNSRTTWYLSPLNLFFDIFCYGSKPVYELADFPEDYQEEINYIIKLFDEKKDYLINLLQEKVEDKQRGMIFFKWFGKNVENSFTIPEFHQKFKYIRTIAISIFNKNHSSSAHCGPQRLTFRLLYNMTPVEDDQVYITVGRHKNIWHKNPLFMFDETIIHQSFNDSDQIRYCVFLDILRPSFAPQLLDFFVTIIESTLKKINKIFYRKWHFIN